MILAVVYMRTFQFRILQVLPLQLAGPYSRRMSLTRAAPCLLTTFVSGLQAKFCWKGNQMFPELDNDLHFGYQVLSCLPEPPYPPPPSPAAAAAAAAAVTATSPVHTRTITAI